MKAKLGVTALVLLFLGGLWLVAAPFAVGYQPAARPTPTLRSTTCGWAASWRACPSWHWSSTPLTRCASSLAVAATSLRPLLAKARGMPCKAVHTIPAGNR